MRTIERRRYGAEELPQKLERVIKAIRSVYEPERIILFGSAAGGGEWHDLDLLVVAETEDRFFERLKKIALALDTWTPTDILILTPEELRVRIQENRFFLVEEILKKGRVVYERRRHPKLVQKR